MQKTAIDAFISHSSVDQEFAVDLTDQLEERGFSCWIAPRNIPAGAEYAASIMDGIENSGCFVLLLSSESNTSSMVRREIERAASKGKPIYPVFLEDIAPSKEIEFFISLNQYLLGWKDGVGGCADSIIRARTSGTDWTKNKLLRRKRFVRFGLGISVLTAAALVSVATIFSEDIRRMLSSPEELALEQLERLGFSVSLGDVSEAVGSSNTQALSLYQQLDMGREFISDSFMQSDVAYDFFSSASGSQDAEEWFRMATSNYLDPNMLILESNGRVDQTLTFYAAQSGSLPLLQSALENGGQPNGFQSLEGLPIALPHFIFPYSTFIFSESSDTAQSRIFTEALYDGGALSPFLMVERNTATNGAYFVGYALGGRADLSIVNGQNNESSMDQFYTHMAEYADVAENGPIQARNYEVFQSVGILVENGTRLRLSVSNPKEFERNYRDLGVVDVEPYTIVPVSTSSSLWIIAKAHNVSNPRNRVYSAHDYVVLRVNPDDDIQDGLIRSGDMFFYSQARGYFAPRNCINDARYCWKRASFSVDEASRVHYHLEIRD